MSLVRHVRQSFLVALVVLISPLASCNSTERSKQVNAREAYREQLGKDQATKFNAVANWPEMFDNDEYSTRRLYTIHLQEALLNTAGRPVQVSAMLGDVFKREGRYFVRFLTTVNWLTLINFELECTEIQARELATIPGDIWIPTMVGDDQFWVIADVKAVKRLEFTVDSQPIGDDEAILHIDISDVFTASGQLIDVVHTPRGRLPEK